MRFLITGGAGFIGSHLAERLLQRGDEVSILDDLSTGSVENIRHLKSDPRFHHVFDTIQNRSLLAEMVDESEVVFHLAAAVGVRLIVESPVRTIETNVNGTQFVLEAACKKKKLVFAAASGRLRDLLSAVAVYAVGGEKLLRERRHELPGAVARFCGVDFAGAKAALWRRQDAGPNGENRRNGRFSI